MGRYSNVRKGYAFDLSDGHYYSSGWERDFARFLNMLEACGVVDGWGYEVQEFSFQSLGYKRGPFTYKPDFAVRFSNKLSTKTKKLLKHIFSHIDNGALVFVEVKGQETGKDRSKWKRFNKHVDTPLEIVKRDKMILIQDNFDVPGWESNVY